MYRGRLIKKQAGKDLLDEGADLRKCEPWAGAGSAAFALEKRVGHGADHHVVLPAGIPAALEVIESEFGFEVLIVLFDGPALMRQADQLCQRWRWRAATRSSACGVRSGRGRVRTAAKFRGRAAAAANRSPGVTRSAAKSASHGGLVPLRHDDAVPRARRQRVAERRGR